MLPLGSRRRRHVVRSLGVLAVVGGLLIGCVTITVPAGPTPTGSLVATPTAAVTPSAVVSPKPSPSPTPTVTAMPTPTATAGTPASPSSSPAGVENYGASTPLFNDGFDDPNSGWGTGTNEGGSVAYGDSTLEIAVTGSGAWERTQRVTGSTSNAVTAEAHWTGTGHGMVGLLCATSNDEMWGATEDAAGNYSFIKLDSQGATVLSMGHLDALKSAADGFAQFALDCAGTATGSFRMQLH